MVVVVVYGKWGVEGGWRLVILVEQRAHPNEITFYYESLNNFRVRASSLYPSGQNTHPYGDINILPSIVCVTTPLYFASNEA